MKRLLLFLLCLSVYGYSQPKLGMSSSYAINPQAATSPTAGIPVNSTFTINAWVKNKGNAAFTGSLTAYVGVDSNNFSSPTRIDSAVFTGVFLNPNDSLLFNDTITVSPAVFKSSGNGNTIVVWPVSPGIQTLDSNRILIYVTDPNGVHELEQPALHVYPNPAGDKLFIRLEKNIELKNVTVYDIYMRKVIDCGFTETIDLSALKPGTYWIRAASAGKTYSALIIKRE